MGAPLAALLCPAGWSGPCFWDCCALLSGRGLCWQGSAAVWRCHRARCLLRGHAGPPPAAARQTLAVWRPTPQPCPQHVEHFMAQQAAHGVPVHHHCWSDTAHCEHLRCVAALHAAGPGWTGGSPGTVLAVPARRLRPGRFHAQPTTASAFVKAHSRLPHPAALSARSKHPEQYRRLVRSFAEHALHAHAPPETWI